MKGPTSSSRAARHASRLLVGLALAVAACEPVSIGPLDPVDPSYPSPQAAITTSTPTFLRFDSAAPALTNPDTSFVATAGEDVSFRLLFENGQGSDRFLRLKLSDETLMQFPPGHPRAGEQFQPGDTITITVSVDPVTLTATLGPSGLRFNPDEPAELELGYRFADPDFDGDGTPDPGLEGSIRMFHEPAPGQPWIPLDSTIDILKDRVKFDDVRSFSRYALAI